MAPELQDRDLALLFYTWQSRYLAQRQYHAKFWPTAGQGPVAARLIKLKEAKLLKSHSLPWLRDRVLYSIGLAGTRALVAAGFTSLPVHDFPKTVADFTPGMKHDLELVDLRIGCETAGHIIHWTSEHEHRLARRQGKGSVRIPDGSFKYEAIDGEAFGLIEYERVGYRRKKYMDILNRLKASAEHKAGYTIFFVCSTSQRAEMLRQWASESLPWVLTPTKIQFGHFEAARDGGLAGGFVDLNSFALVLPNLLN